jgi:hypothetical protein
MAVIRDSVKTTASSLDSAVLTLHDPSDRALRNYRLAGTPEALLLDSEGGCSIACSVLECFSPIDCSS